MCVFISEILWNYSWFTWCICRFVGKFHLPTGHQKKTSKSRQQLEVNRGRRGLIAHVLLVRWYLETCLWWCQKAEWQKTWSFWTEQVVFSHAKNRQQPKFASKNDDVSESIVLTDSPRLKGGLWFCYYLVLYYEWVTVPDINLYIYT